MKLLQDPVGLNRARDGAAAVNRPADLIEVGTTLKDLGYLELEDLTRDAAMFTDEHSIQTGFFNRESVIEINDHHDWGTSWLAELIEKGGDAYRKTYLKTNKAAALITLNDASLPRGGASPDQCGHQTGLSVDLLLPRIDGTVRRNPQSISAASPFFDRDAMKAMLIALDSTKSLKGVFFYDKGNEAGYPPTFQSNEICRKHAQVTVKRPDRVEGTIPEGVTTATALTTMKAEIQRRLVNLGYNWADSEKIDVYRHAFDEKGHPRRVGDRYAIIRRDSEGFDWAMRLFLAIINEQSIVNHKNPITALTDEDLKWLFAKNAPRWVPMPIGTIDAHPRIISAIRCFQAIVQGHMTTAASSGCIAPNDDFEDWLNSAKAPPYLPLLEAGAGYDVVDVPHDQLRRFDTKVPDWTRELVRKAAAKFAGGRIAIRHPGAAYYGSHGAESGLRILIDVIGNDAAARRDIVKAFAEAQEELFSGSKLKFIHNTEDAALLALVSPSKDPMLLSLIEVQIPNRLIATVVPPSVARTAVFIAPRVKPADETGQAEEIRQRPHLGLITDAGKVQAIALQIQRPIPAENGWAYQPLVFELPLAQQQDPLPGFAATDLADGVRFAAAGDLTNKRERIKTQTTPVTALGAEVAWSLKPDGFNAPQPFHLNGFQPFEIASTRIVFEKGFSWDGNEANSATNCCYLEFLFGRGLLAKPMKIEVALIGTRAGAIDSTMIVSYVSANDSARRRAIADCVVNDIEKAVGEFEETDVASGESAAEEAEPGGQRRLFEGWRFRFPVIKYKPDLTILGPGLELNGAFDLLLGRTGSLGINLNGELVGELDLALGSSMVRLKTTGQANVVGNFGTLGFDIALFGGLPGFKLVLDPFQKIELGDRTAALANAFDRGNVLDKPLVTVPLIDADPGKKELFSIVWSLDGPLVGWNLLDRLFAARDLVKAEINKNFRLSALTGRLLGSSNESALQFDEWVGQKCRFERLPRQGDKKLEDWRLTVPLRVRVLDKPDGKDVIASDCELKFEVDRVSVSAKALAFQPGSFSCSATNMVTVRNPGGGGYHTEFGDLISLHVPEGAQFLFNLDPRGPELIWDPKPSKPGGEPPVISLRIPAAKGGTTDASLKDLDKRNENKFFAFDLDRFDLKPAGLSLHAGVRTNRVKLGESSDVVFADPLNVHPVDKNSNDKAPRIGELEVSNGRLVAGSLRATGRLPYFDNALGTLGLFVSEDADKALHCLGTFDVTGSERFEIAALYAQCEIRALHLETKYAVNTGKWESSGEITGSVKFTPPQGKSAADTGPLASLFQGVTVSFEDLDLKKLASGAGNFRLHCPPKTFRFGEILRVDLRGLDLGLGRDGNGIAYPREFQLLGDINLEKLPGINSSLTFGGITLSPGGTPSFSVSRIAGQISTPGGFAMDGVLDHIKNDTEVGFAGGFGLKLNSFPRINGVTKLTRITARDGSLVPSFAVFLEADYTLPLFANFYLRRIGAGIGLRQGITGLIPKPGESMPQRILKFIDNPAGLPEPRNVSSWQPIVPDSASSPMNWMFVASGLITFGNLKFDKPHTFAGSMMLGVDESLNVTLAVNAWLFTSPDETRQADFQQKPAVRGAVAISVDEQRLFAYFKTLRDPKMGKNTPELLARALKNGETSLLLSVDRNGFLLEVGWPWETKFDYSEGLLKGELRTGFRFGYYRGVLLFGLNYAVSVSLEAREQFDAGPGNVVLSARGNAYFRTSFTGAITSDYQAYLLGDVAFGATLNLSATLNWEISFKICGRRISKSFSISSSLSLSIHASLIAALDRRSAVGFRGRADVRFSLGSFGIGGTVNFGLNESLIDSVKEELDRLLPPSIRQQVQQEAQNTELVSAAPVWNYRYYRLPNDRRRVRILFFPAPGNHYPKLDPAAIPEPKDRFRIALRQPKAFVGLVGHEVIEGDKTISIKDGVVSWIEDYTRVVVKGGKLESLTPDELKAITDEQKRAYTKDETILDVLAVQPKDGDPKNRLSGKEVRDERTRQHGVTRADDATHSLGDADLRSPNLPCDSQYDQEVKKAQRAKPASVRTVLPSKPVTTFTPAKIANWPIGLTDVEQATLQLAAVYGTPPLPVLNTTAVWYWKYTIDGQNRISFAVRTNPAAAALTIDEGVSLRVAGAILNEWSLPGKTPTAAGADELEKMLALFGLPKLDTALEVLRLSEPGDPRPRWEVIQKANAAVVNDKDKVWHIGANAEGLVVVEPIEPQSDEPKPLDPGLVLHELLQVMKDPRFQAGKKTGSEAQDYVLAPYLRLVVEFDLSKLDAANAIRDDDRIDPVPLLINLDPEMSGFVGQPLVPVVSPVEGRLPEYDLIVENIFQSEDRICLAWDFIPEESTLAATNRPFDAYRELEQYTVTRVHRTGGSLEPKVTNLVPAWLVGKDLSLIRPQYQFVDTDVAAIGDGELIDYRIEARSTDRVLSSSEITVTRQIVRPLAAVPQPMAVQSLIWDREEKQYRQVFTVALIPDQPEKPIPGELPDPAMAEQLQVFYRIVPASTVGSYGAEAPSGYDLDLEPSASDDYDIRFPDSSHLRPLAWRDATPLTPGIWKESKRNGVSEPVLLSREVDWPDGVTAGSALELYVGRQINANRDGKPLQRSPLTRCRHSLFLGPLPENAFFDQHREKADTHLGNTVSAFERIPEKAWPAPELLTERLNATVVYESAPSFFEDDPLLLPSIQFDWQHDVRGRDGFDQPKEGVFDPIIGYTLEHFDRLAPEHYDLDGNLRVRHMHRHTLRTMPEKLYRAHPGSIVVQGLKTEFEDSVATIAEAVEQRLNDNPRTNAFAAVPGNWKPLPSKVAMAATSIPANIEYRLPIFGPFHEPPIAGGDDPERDVMPVLWPGGPVWLDAELVAAVKVLLELPGLKGGQCRLVLHRPLVDRLPDSSGETEPIPEKEAEKIVNLLDSLRQSLDRTQDPYGWHALEALGRSCECHFSDANNQQVSADRIHAELKGTPLSNVGVAAFLAGDGRTRLNVLRLFVARPLFKDDGAGNLNVEHERLCRAAILQVAGNLVKDFWKSTDATFTKVVGEVAKWLQTKTTSWLKWIAEALTSSGVVGPGNTFAHWTDFTEDARYGRASSRNKTAPRAVPLVPIDGTGRVRFNVAVGDKWAHRFCFALWPVRRYDLIRETVAQVQTAAVDLRDASLWTAVDVDRTKPLVPPKLVATPMLSGVQFLALRHPAEFASNATVDNQGHIQFHGQTFHWPQQRIPETIRKWDKFEIENPPTAPEETLWTKYLNYVAKLKETKAGDLPLNHELLRRPLTGSTQGLYGVDRLVIPEAPAYYEFRTKSTVSAGLVTSESEYSAWVQPIIESFATPKLDDPKRNRQVPRVPRADSVTWDDGAKKLVVVVPLALLRDLLPPDFRPQWNACELIHPTFPVEVGFLPDLAMSYRVFFRSDPFSTLEPNLPKFQELLMLAQVDINNGKPVCKSLPSGVKVDPADCQFRQSDSGAFTIRLAFAFEDTSATRIFLDRIVAVPALPHAGANELVRLIAVQGVRSGAQSELMEFLSEPSQ